MWVARLRERSLPKAVLKPPHSKRYRVVRGLSGWRKASGVRRPARDSSEFIGAFGLWIRAKGSKGVAKGSVNSIVLL